MRRHRALRSTVALVAGWIVVRGAMLATITVPVTASLDEGKAIALPNLPSVLFEAEIPAERLAIGRELLGGKETSPASGLSPTSITGIRHVASTRAADASNHLKSDPVALKPPPQMPNSKEPISHSSGVDIFPAPPMSDVRMEPALPAKPIQRTRYSLPYGSAWALVRGRGGSSGLATNGQLGGSQIGARAAVPLSLGNRITNLALHGRLSTALEAPHQSEAGLGLLLSVNAVLPVQLIAERRIRISKGGRNAFAAIVATGFDDRPVVGDLHASGYAQAGLVGIRSCDGFVDGAFRLEKTITSGKSSGLRLGAGVWGAAQPGIYRVDIGPRIARELDSGGRRATVALEWRQRVAGHALPPSGLTLTIGSDF
jgi:hypothetical protein